MKVEIIHDILARKIGEKMSSEERQLRKIGQFLDDSLEAYQKNQSNEYLLEKKDLDYVEPFLGKLRPTEEIHQLLENSRKHQKKQRILYGFGMAGIAITLVVLLGMTGKNTWEYQKISSDNKSKLDEKEKLNNKIESTNKEIFEIETKNKAKSDELALSQEKLIEGEKNREKSEKEMEVQKVEEKKIQEQMKKFQKEKEENQKLVLKAKEAIESKDVGKQEKFFEDIVGDEKRWSGLMKNKNGKDKMTWNEAKEVCANYKQDEQN